MDALYICNFGFCADFIFFWFNCITLVQCESVRKCLSALREQQSNIQPNSCQMCHCKSHISMTKPRYSQRESEREKNTNTYIHSMCVYLYRNVNTFLHCRSNNKYVWKLNRLLHDSNGHNVSRHAVCVCVCRM